MSAPTQNTCVFCGEPMPKGEEMFKYHGYSGPCPAPILPVATPPAPVSEPAEPPRPICGMTGGCIDRAACVANGECYSRFARRAAPDAAPLTESEPPHAGQWRKKPVVIEAMQLPGEDEDATEALVEWLHANLPDGWRDEGRGVLSIPTLEGTMYASPGDWIIKGVKGECYPCKPDIFALTYEPASAPLDEGTPEKVLSAKLRSLRADYAKSNMTPSEAIESLLRQVAELSVSEQWAQNNYSVVAAAILPQSEFPSDLVAEVERLRASLSEAERDREHAKVWARFVDFALGVLDNHGDWDGGIMQDEAREAGILAVVEVNEACGEGCRCVEYGFPMVCYRFTEAAHAARRFHAGAIPEAT